MKLQQLKYIWEVAHHDLNVSATRKVSTRHNRVSVSKYVFWKESWVLKFLPGVAST